MIVLLLFLTLAQSPIYTDTPIVKGVTIGQNRCFWYLKYPSASQIQTVCWSGPLVSSNSVGTFNSLGQGTITGSMDLSIQRADGTIDLAPIIKWAFNLGKYSIQVYAANGSKVLDKNGTY